MAFKIGRTGDHASRKCTVLSFGDNGSGKTHFAATWPHPYFVVPAIASNEMKTVAGYNLPCMTFETMDDFKQGMKAIATGMKSGKIQCKTLIIDNLTTMQMVFESELKETKNVDKLEWEQWGKFKNYFVNVMKTLHGWPCHVIWITHTHKENIFTILGDARNFIPNNCDLILYHEARDPGGRKDTQYIVHMRRHGQWPARIRRDMSIDVPFPAQIGPEPSPHYNLLAPHLGLPSLEDAEAEVTGDLLRTLSEQ